ncbi:MAG: hypothetical protein IIZ78_10860 [Clostridiales bacterium]|nr:hypothetical protein [Clostridiales bacterium]
MPNTNFQTIHQMGQAINEVVRQATGRDAVQNIDMDFVTVAFKKKPLSVSVAPLIGIVEENAVIEFTATVENAEGPISYQWQYTEDDGATWANTGVTGNRTATVTITATNERLRFKYRCTVQAGGETAASEAVYFVRPEFAINEQPQDSVAQVGETATFTVVAQGVSQYQWECKFPDGDWFNSTSAGNNTASVSFTVTDRNKTLQFRCKLTDAQGEVHYTNIVSIIWN